MKTLPETAPRRVLITAGPTWEPLDPVRFLGNRSSGKMGFAVAAAAAASGWEVILVSGPVALATPPGVAQRLDVECAAEMAAAVKARLGEVSVIVCAAAVADWTPAAVAPQKVKKEAKGDRWTVELVRSVDILGSLRGWGFAGVLVGFAAETERLAEHARAKLAAKGCDWLVANDVSRADIGFGSDDNELQLFRAGQETPDILPKAPKAELARQLWAKILPAAPSDSAHGGKELG